MTGAGSKWKRRARPCRTSPGITTGHGRRKRRSRRRGGVTVSPTSGSQPSWPVMAWRLTTSAAWSAIRPWKWMWTSRGAGSACVGRAVSHAGTAVSARHGSTWGARPYFRCHPYGDRGEPGAEADCGAEEEPDHRQHSLPPLPQPSQYRPAHFISASPPPASAGRSSPAGGSARRSRRTCGSD